MTTDGSGARKEEKCPIQRIVLRRTVDSGGHGGSKAELVVYVEEKQHSVEFKEKPPKQYTRTAKSRTAGVLASKQAPTLQAFVLLLWLADRRERGCEENPLLFDEAKKLRFWDRIQNERSFEARLHALLEDSSAIGPPSRQARIHSGITIKIEGTDEERRQLLTWAGVRQVAAEADIECPFPGLEFFSEDRAADFFGREIEVAEALTQLAESRPPRRWLQIDGPSGVGKSSFARAGIAPAVRAGRLTRSLRQWVVVVLRPGYDPIANLARGLVKRATPPLDVRRSLDAVLEELRSSRTALASLLHESAPDNHGVLLVIDQLEEAFTLAYTDATAVRQFAALLAAALDDRELSLILVTTIRSDFVTRMGELPALEAKLPTQAVRYYLCPMDEAALRAAVERPAERVGLKYEAALVDRILADARTSRGALPLVAHVLEALHAQREGLMLTRKAYDLIGGVGGALTKTADETIARFDEDGQARARKLVLRLVKLGRGSEDTRQTVLRDAAIQAAGGGPEAERVLARLSGGRALGLVESSNAPARLVVVSGDAGSERVDLVHETLIKQWTALRQWLVEARMGLELRDDVEEAARIWEASGSIEDALPRGALLMRFRAVEQSALQEGARRYLLAAGAAEHRADLEKRMREEERRRVEEELMSRRDDARRQTAIAEARRLVKLAGGALARNQPQQEQLLLLEAWTTIEAAGITLFAGVEQALVDAVRDTGLPLASHGITVCAAFSEDGSQIVIGYADKIARVWRANGEGAPVILSGHEGSITNVAFSPDGRHIVTSSDDGTARVWDADGSGEPLVLRGHSSRVTSAAFSPDGRHIVTSSDDGTARLWNADGAGWPAVLRGHEAAVARAEFSHDGQHIVTASDDGTARVWNVDCSGKPIVLRGPPGKVRSAAFNGDGSRIVTVSGTRAWVWKVDGTGGVNVLEHDRTVTSAAFSPRGDLLVTVCDGNSARVWNEQRPFGADRSLEHDSRVMSAAFSPDGQRIVTACVDGTAWVWDASHEGKPRILRGHEAPLQVAMFSPDGHRILTVSNYDGLARVWNASQDDNFGLFRHTTAVRSAAFSPDGQRIVAACDDGTARVWNVDSTGESVVLRGHEDHIWCAAFSPDGQHIITASGDSVARVWSADGNVERVIPRVDQNIVEGVAFTPEGDHVVVALCNVVLPDDYDTADPLLRSAEEKAAPDPAVIGGSDHIVITRYRFQQWGADRTAGSLVLHGDETLATKVTFSSDCRRAAGASFDNAVRVWNAEGFGEPLVLRGHEDRVTSVVFSSDGQRIASASDDQTVRVWYADGTGKPLVLHGHEGRVVSVAFSPNGQRIASTSEDNTTRVWNMDGQGEAIVLQSHKAFVSSVTFSPDGRSILTASFDGTARVCIVDGSLLADLLRARVGRNFTREEWRRFFGDAPYRKTCEQWRAATDSDPRI